MTYEEQQLKRLNIGSKYPLKIVVHDDEGRTTNFLNVSQSLLDALRNIEVYREKIVTEKESQQ